MNFHSSFQVPETNPSGSKVPGGRQKTRFHPWIGSSLITFSILAITSGLFLNHLLINNYDDMLSIDRIWNERIETLSRIRFQLTQSLLPCEKIFVTEKKTDALKTINELLSPLQKKLDQALEETIRGNIPASQKDLFVQEFNGLGHRTAELEKMAAGIIESFGQVSPEESSRRLAALAQARIEAGNSLSKLTRLTFAVKKNLSRERQQKASILRRLQGIAGLLLLAAVTSLIFYRRRVKIDEEHQKKQEQIFLETIRENELRFRRLAEHAPVGIFVTDERGDCDFVNNYITKLISYSPAEILGTEWVNTIHPHDRETVVRRWETAVATSHTFQMELRFLTKKQQTVWVSVHAVPLTNASGALTGHLGTLMDITARRDAEESLRASEQRFKSLVDNVPGIIYRCAFDANWTVYFISDEVLRLTGYPASDFFHNEVRSYASIIHPEDTLEVEKAVELGVREKRSYTLSYRIIHKDGNIRWVYEKGEGSYDQDGKVLWLDGAILDITEQHQAQAELEKSLAQLREREARITAIVKTAADGIVTLDEYGRITSFNPSAETIFGYSSSEVIGIALTELMPDHLGEDPAVTLSTLLKSPIPRSTGTHFETLGRHKDGTRIPVELSINEWKADDSLMRAVIIRDVRERKIAESKIVEAAQIKSEFAAMVSHELRTPLTAILEGICLVYDETFGQINRDQKEVLEIAKRNVERLSRLINDVLDFQKLESGHMQLHLEKCLLNRVLEEIKDSFVLQAASKGLQLHLDLDPKLQEIFCDPDRMLQVIANLVNNAIKFTDRGTITLRTQDAGKWILLSVEDQGRGIRKEDIPKLFQPFSQVASAGDRPTGTGLGLMICRQIIEKHNGILRVKSELGKGSVFQITLPVQTGSAI